MGPLENKTLCRRYARYVIVSMVLGMLCIVMKWELPRGLVPWLRPHQWDRLEDVFRLAGGALLLSGLFIWLHELRCPYCRRGIAMPWWRGDETYFCCRCGRKLVFDDMPEDPPAE